MHTQVSKASSTPECMYVIHMYVIHSKHGRTDPVFLVLLVGRERPSSAEYTSLTKPVYTSLTKPVVYIVYARRKRAAEQRRKNVQDKKKK
jgi:hypothetical protein